jgi:periplasmic divalent cation tolerance protein
MENKIKVMFTTFSKKEDALKIAEELVELNLSPCIQFIPQIQSIYKWEGKVKKEEEILLLIKYDIQKESELITYLKEYHSYEIPEIISTKFDIENSDYIQWFFSEK